MEYITKLCKWTAGNLNRFDSQINTTQNPIDKHNMHITETVTFRFCKSLN